MNPISTVYQRELKSYFTQPTAYAVIIIFLLLTMTLTFTFGNFMLIGEANLQWSFFPFFPFILMILVPAIGMRLWTEEQHSGTIELLGTFPISTWSAILGKYFAAGTVWVLAILLTFPLWITVNYLGDPDNLTILSGYLGASCMALTFLAITCLISAFTKDQVVCLIVSVTACVFIVVIGHESVLRLLENAVPASFSEALASLGAWDHYQSLMKGHFRLQDFIWFLFLSLACLIGTNAILNAKRS